MANQDEEMPLTLPDTQNVDELLLTQSQEVTSSRQIIWGRLCPNMSTLKKLEMSNDSYTLGRHKDCDIYLTSDELKSTWLSVMSKIHFRISRVSLNNGTGDTVVYLEDLSHNGTFVNRTLVGKGQKVVLQNNDTIALAKATFEVYIFMSTSTPEINGLPPELRTKYAVSRTLGSGACGEVKLVFTIVGCKRFAMKTIAKRTTTGSNARNTLNDPDKIMNEVRILKALRHPCIIRTEEIVDTPKMVYIVLELMEGGELFDRISKSNGLTEKVAKLIFYQVVLAVNYLHERGITHRDLKPENILLASDAEFPLVKVSDFGLSKFVNTESLMQTFCGTPMYVAPEILVTSGRGSYTNQVDVWSLGVILYVCLTGHVPFASQNPKISLQEQIVKGMYRFPPAMFVGVSENAKDLIRRMMTTDPKKRMTIRQVLLHPWLQDRRIIDIVDTLISSNEENNVPNRRENTLTSSRNTDPYVFDEPAPLYKRMRRE